MTEDQGEKEDKFDFTTEGELLGYIGLDQARVKAIEHARDNTDFYGPSYAGVQLVWEVISTEESEDYYDVLDEPSHPTPTQHDVPASPRQSLSFHSNRRKLLLELCRWSQRKEPLCHSRPLPELPTFKGNYGDYLLSIRTVENPP